MQPGSANSAINHEKQTLNYRADEGSHPTIGREPTTGLRVGA
jgi:hypothetical protein